MNDKRGHDNVEHAADMGITGWGNGMSEAFEETALAMFELIVEREGIEPRVSVDIRASGRDKEELLVDFLNNLLTRAGLEELVFLAVDVKSMREEDEAHEFRLEATASGVPVGLVRERLLREVKAVTYFGVSVAEDGFGTTTATAVVDL